MADIFKDIGDKIGDAVLNKSGEAVDALNALGLSAKKLAGESPDKQLIAISNALGKINTNAEKPQFSKARVMTFQNFFHC